MGHRFLAAALPVCALVCALAGAADATEAPQDGALLDITDYRQTFRERFDHFDVSAWGPGTTWIAHTPWNGDFGEALFVDPKPGFPFATSGGMLRIEARKQPDGRWQSGLISSRSRDGLDGHGFAQLYGYFEIETKLPPGSGTWPAFWLVGVTPHPRAEIDALEYYGNATNSYHANVHVWRGGGDDFGDGKVVDIPDGSAISKFNRYGVLVEHDWVTFYFNRKAVWHTPTKPEYRQPLYMLANLALGSGWPIDKVPNPSFMYIKSIAAYAARS